MSERYEGPIEPGMRFEWGSGSPASEWVTVTELRERDGEVIVGTVGASTRRPAGRVVWNDERRFREAVRPHPGATRG